MPVCLTCGKRAYSNYCVQHKPRKSIKVNKRPKQRGKRYYEYEAWKHDIAIPWLNENYGHQCSDCGRTEGLHVDHIKNRGSRPDLKMDLTNVQFLCGNCHRDKTDHQGRYRDDHTTT